MYIAYKQNRSLKSLIAKATLLTAKGSLHEATKMKFRLQTTKLNYETTVNWPDRHTAIASITSENTDTKLW